MIIIVINILSFYTSTWYVFLGALNYFVFTNIAPQVLKRTGSINLAWGLVNVGFHCYIIGLTVDCPVVMYLLQAGFLEYIVQTTNVTGSFY